METKEKGWEKIEIHQKRLDNVLGRTPQWLTKWGMMVMFFFISAMFVISVFFKYPEMVDAAAVIITENPPVNIMARNTGKLDTIFVNNGATVKRGEILAIIENSASYLNILKLKNNLGKYDSLNNNLLMVEQLGSIQSLYSNYIKQYNEYRSFLQLATIEKKIQSIQQQIIDYSKYRQRLQDQVDNQRKSVEIYNKQTKRDSQLYVNGFIASIDFEKSQMNDLQLRNSYNSTRANYASVLMQTNQLKFQLIDLRNQQSEQNQHYLISLKESFDNLKAGIVDWEKTFVLYSPINGKITFNKFWMPNQFVMIDESVFTIIPIKSEKIIGRIKIPINGSGRIKTGQNVFIRLDNFPYTEFGSIHGIIKSISLIPEKTVQGYFYNAEVYLPNRLTTNYKKKLPLNQEMQGTAKIITKNLSIFERLFYPIKSALKLSVNN